MELITNHYGLVSGNSQFPEGVSQSKKIQCVSLKITNTSTTASNVLVSVDVYNSTTTVYDTLVELIHDMEILPGQTINVISPNSKIILLPTQQFTVSGTNLSVVLSAIEGV